MQKYVGFSFTLKIQGTMFLLKTWERGGDGGFLFPVLYVLVCFKKIIEENKEPFDF